MISYQGIKALLLDIEGTTTPVDFVYQRLFPYAERHLSDFLRLEFDDDDRELLRQEHAREQSGAPVWSDPPLAYLRWLMQQDRKSPGLKSVQGKIWQRGYLAGELTGELFPDVAGSLQRWHQAGLSINIFSSGSIQAQRLIFGYSVAGNLTPLISNFFDTTSGPKRERESYEKICRASAAQPETVLFVSDMAAELEAARQAGLQVCLSLRPGNQPQPGEWPSIRSFDELDLK